MAAITAGMVKELREKTGVGMMDCKSALNENNGDIEAAIDWLRTKGLAKVAKKAGRVTSEGLVAALSEGQKAVLVEVNSETDFVARNDQFQSLVKDVAQTALKTSGSLEAILSGQMSTTGKSVDESVKDAIATIGENITVRRADSLEVSEGVIASYVHASVSEGLGKIGVLVALESLADKDALSALGKQIAMHIAASNPLSLSVDDLDPQTVERERSVFIEQAKESGKPEAIIEKMVEGRIRKFYEESVLLKQAFVMDTDKSVEKAIEDQAKELGSEINLSAFKCFRLGEGVEKEESDFAAEVMAAVGQS